VGILDLLVYQNGKIEKRFFTLYFKHVQEFKLLRWLKGNTMLKKTKTELQSNDTEKNSTK
jgi:hypothetical protein